MGLTVTESHAAGVLLRELFVVAGTGFDDEADRRPTERELRAAAKTIDAAISKRLQVGVLYEGRHRLRERPR